MKIYSKTEFWVTLILLTLTVAISAVAYNRWYSLSVFVGPYLFIHWIGLIGTVFITVFTPIYYILNRKRPKSRRTLLKLHVYGNLVSYLLVSVHFAQHLGRLSSFVSNLGEGTVLFVVLTTITATGIMERFQIAKSQQKTVKLVHHYAVIVFYAVVLLHTLQGFNII
ncbi:MAG: hypothetical protein NWF03_08890 [Candidatus Bathyarchaeota archaeon]|nr:hypothetical protein [Candidatus Bathyarchaeota archaeon]